MAAKKAALLEKRLRREKEAQERRQQQELDQEQKREAARCVSLHQSQHRHSRVSFEHERSVRTALFFCRLKAEEELQKKEDEKARREYIKNEYLRRKQLKLMEEMDEVIKPRTGSLKKKPRPKSIHRDVVESTPLARMTGKKKTTTTTQTYVVTVCPLLICAHPGCCCPAGVRPRGFSVSSVSLASLNLPNNDRDQPDNKKNNR